MVLVDYMVVVNYLHLKIKFILEFISAFYIVEFVSVQK